MSTHPYAEHEGTPLWGAVERALEALVRNDDVAFRAERAHVVAALCAEIAAAGLLRDSATRPDTGTPAGFASYLEQVARDGIVADEWDERVGTHYADGAVEEARRQAVLLQMRLRTGGVSGEQAAEYFRALARKLRESA